MNSEKYLHKDVFGKYSYSGSLFVEGSGMNQIIYGHNMRNGTMFGSLKRLRDKEILKKNRYFTIYTRNGVYRYLIFSLFETKVGSKVYSTNFEADQGYEAYLSFLKDHSEICLKTSPNKDTPTVILSTCAEGGSKRFVVCGMLVGKL